MPKLKFETPEPPIFIKRQSFVKDNGEELSHLFARIRKAEKHIKRKVKKHTFVPSFEPLIIQKLEAFLAQLNAYIRFSPTISGYADDQALNKED